MKSYSNNGLDCVAHYYRDHDGREIDLVIERDGHLHPIEIKKTASPSPELTRAFRALDSAGTPRGMGAVVCTKQEFSALDRLTAIVPAWAV